MKTLMLIVISVLVLIIAIMTATLVRNQARLFHAPGLSERLSVYLTQHEAETSDNHSFPELRTPRFKIEAEALFDAVITVASELGWQVEKKDAENLSASIVVTTPLLGFQDDLEVQVILTNDSFEGATSTLWLRSSSRVGQADFAANAGHIQALVAAVEHRIRSDAIRLFENI